MEITRRTFLERNASFAALGSSRNNRAEKYTGYMYDPLTKEVKGTASAVIRDNSGKLIGRLKLNSSDWMVRIPIEGNHEEIIEGEYKNRNNRRVTSQLSNSNISTRGRKLSKKMYLDIQYTPGENITGEFNSSDINRSIAFVLKPKNNNTTSNVQAHLDEVLRRARRNRYEVERYGGLNNE